MINRRLDQPIHVGNYESIHGALSLAEREKMSTPFVISKFLELADYYRTQNSLRESISLLISALDLSPTTIEVFDSLGLSLSAYIKQNQNELCDEDIRWANTAIEMLFSINDSHSGANHLLDKISGIKKLKSTLNSLKIINDGKVESPHTHFLSSISLKQYQNLTPDERRKKVSELFARKLLELKKEKKGKGDKSNA